jgi:hypothetical protein
MYSTNLKDYTTVRISDMAFKKSRETGLVFDHIRDIWFKHNFRSFREEEMFFYKKTKKLDINQLNNDFINKISHFSAINKEVPVFDLRSRSILQLRTDQTYKTFNKTFKLTTPKAITDDILYAAIDKFKKEVCDFPGVVDIDYMRLGLNIIIVKTLYKKTHNIKKYFDKCDPDFVQVPVQLLLDLGTHPLYMYYWKALLHSNIIVCDNKYYSFEDNYKAYGYKINDIYYPKKEDEWEKMHQMHDITNDLINHNIGKYREIIRLKKDNAKKLYTDMMFDVETLFSTIDTDEVREYYKDNIHEFYDLEKGDEEGLKKKLNDKNTLTLEQALSNIEVIQNDNYYFNVSDQFGGRFHSAFTNIKSCFRKFVKYDNERYINVDISNSQMIFLATIIENPDLASVLMKNVRWNLAKGTSLSEVINIIKELKENTNNNDLDLFIQKTKEGTIYEFISEYLGCERSQAKLDLIKVIFSNDIQFLKIKRKIGKLFPTLIELANVLNVKDDTHYLPKICQKFESEIFINRITKAFFNVKKYPAVTIHDSVMVHPKDLKSYTEVYNQVFKEIGLDPFKIKLEHYCI